MNPKVQRIVGLLLVAIGRLHCECPDDELVKPCICTGDEHVVCEGDKPQDFCKMFAALGKKLADKDKDLELFVLRNKVVEEIPEKCFDDIFFREIRIENATNLKRIHSNAFVGTDELTEKFYFVNSPKFESTLPLLDTLARFKKLEAISIGNIGLKEIPSNAFKPMKTLYWLWISDPELTKIGEKSFINLNALTEFHITNTGITEIPKETFAFTQKSDIPLDLCLYNNPKLVKFDANAFTKTQRPTDLDFAGQRFIDNVYQRQISILEEEVFKPFLEANEENKIEMSGQQFNCNDCKNAWLKKHPKLLERVLNVKCADDKDVNDSFGACK